MNITLDQALCYCALIEEGSFQAAAKKLRRSHPAVVYAVKLFERQCGVTLLNRSGYRTKANLAGEKIYRLCGDLIDASAKIKQCCSDLSAGWEPTVRVVYDGVLPSKPFLKLFQYFKRENVPTLLDIYAEYLQGVEKSFLELGAHFMISVIPTKVGMQMQSIPLSPITLVLVAKKNHPLIQDKKKWTLAEMKNFNFFTVRGADRSLELGTKELEETSTLHLSDFTLKKEAILEGSGFGWLPRYMIHQELRSGKLAAVMWEFSNQRKLTPRLIYSRKNTQGLACQKILTALRAAQGTWTSF